MGVQRGIPVRAQEKVIKVGYFDKCCVVQEGTGEYSGYIVDYLEKIA